VPKAVIKQNEAVFMSEQEYFTDNQLARRFAVSRATIWRWVSNSEFPQPIRLGPKCTRWRKDEVEAWEAKQAAGAAAVYGKEVE